MGIEDGNDKGKNGGNTDDRLYYAHTSTDRHGNTLPPNEWEPLFSEECPTCHGSFCPDCAALKPQHGHINKVAHWTSVFAADMFRDATTQSAAREWGRIAGLWHDLGKFSDEFQRYLRAAGDVHEGESTGKVDHATAGAQRAVREIPILGHLLAHIIAAHHSGLLDTVSENACLDARLKKKLFPLIGASDSLTQSSQLPIPPFVRTALKDNPDPCVPSFFTRMVFSCLVDADFLATEAFMTPRNAALRTLWPTDILQQMSQTLDAHLQAFSQNTLPINQLRAEILQNCRAAAEQSPGFFSLTVPTGGGKTLSSLAFALRHACRHQQTRVIYVVPFTSIIEQNAAVFSSVFHGYPAGTVLEHHSNLDVEHETTETRLATENWNAPLVVTTAVQFYESLHACRTSRCRKLHNIANAVIVLDEAQTLPVDYLAPCLRVLRELVSHYHCSVVLCTATPPAIHKQDDFPIGLETVREIIPNPAELYKKLKRVEVHNRSHLDDTALSSELLALPQVLCIVNTRKHAQTLYSLLGGSDAHFHLSALMCPEHRSRILDEIKQRLDQGKTVRVITTQLIEAGVDIDFPVVYRSMAGLDSIAQAAGRCNRNGRLPSPGQVHVFRSEHTSSEKYFAETASVAHEVLDAAADPLDLDRVQHYFDLYYYRQKTRWDRKGILSACLLQQKRDQPFLFQYKTISDAFRLIESPQITVFIPWGERGKALCAELRNSAIPLNRALMRGLQRFTVSVYPNLFYANERAFEKVRDEFHILICPELHYSPHCGLTLSSEIQPPPTLIC